MVKQKQHIAALCKFANNWTEYWTVTAKIK